MPLAGFCYDDSRRCINRSLQPRTTASTRGLGEDECIHHHGVCALQDTMSSIGPILTSILRYPFCFCNIRLPIFWRELFCFIIFRNLPPNLIILIYGLLWIRLRASICFTSSLRHKRCNFRAIDHRENVYRGWTYTSFCSGTALRAWISLDRQCLKLDNTHIHILFWHDK